MSWIELSRRDSIDMGMKSYFLLGYGCECGVWKPARDEGAMTLVTVYIRRPGGCRIAVVQPVTCCALYLLVDMMRVEMRAKSGATHHQEMYACPEAIMKMRSMDAAIVAAVSMGDCADE